MKRIKDKVGLLLGVLFIILGIATLPHYGINWDTINHLPRGQAYLNYYLTGNKDYSNLKPFTDYWQDESSLGIQSDTESFNRRSLYQNEGVPFYWYMEHDGGGHPPLSDIFSSIFNLILFQKLGIINDIDSYRVYGIVLSGLLVCLLYYWLKTKTNKISAVVASVTLATYPLFWSESHFNTEKDIPETVFWSFVLYAVWKGITEKKPRWILLSGLIFGFALGTKFNILFIPFIIIPWLLFYIFTESNNNVLTYVRRYRKLILASICAPIIGLVVFMFFWPYLWQDPISGFSEVFSFYKTIGTTENFDSRFITIGGFNTYPLIWILTTTPLYVLILSGIGIVTSFYKIVVKRDEFYVLILLWFIVPIARVSTPGSNIYGGVRQIMEFVPALSLLSGIGLYTISQQKLSFARYKNYFVYTTFCILIVLHVGRLISIHPNENVYFNSLIGGLEGAKAYDIPSWGNSFGAAYRQGVAWINDNATENANVVYAYELIPNIPRIQLRRDFELHNINRSGSAKAGEYAITLSYDGTAERSYYDSYLERMIEPVYSVKVDGVSILNVWINDLEHTKEEYKQEKEIKPQKIINSDGATIIDLGSIQRLARVEWNFSSNLCSDLEFGYSSISQNNADWIRLPGNLPEQNWGISTYGFQPSLKHFIQPFAGDEARFIKYSYSPKDACFSKIDEVKVYTY